MNQLFDRIPERLFSPLSGGNRRIYASLILDLYPLFFDQIHADVFPSKETVRHEIEERLSAMTYSWQDDEDRSLIQEKDDNYPAIAYRRLLDAGWFEEEYKAYGYPFPKPKRRVDELEESLTIYKKIFTEDVTDFDGKFWTLKRHRNFPKPIQKPYPQIVVGTAGRRMIDIACREADGVNLDVWYAPNIEDIPPRIAYINERLEKHNRDPSKFEISIFPFNSDSKQKPSGIPQNHYYTYIRIIVVHLGRDGPF